ncbi:MAG: 4'-phosphopantetheinyl transferase family protein [Mucilaginibacter sp.]
MIICCHSEITRQWDEQELAERLLLLPADLQQVALSKRRWIDKQLSIAGKLLLLQVLNEMGSSLALSHLQYNTHKRPYFDESIDFNISHSGTRVTCCATNQGRIGIDIEQIKTISLSEYPDYFTKNEWDYIDGHEDEFKGFYNLWTRKEAVVKAIGTGFHTPLSSVDVVADSIEYDNIIYHIQPLDIAAGYPCHIASTTDESVTLIPVEL